MLKVSSTSWHYRLRGQIFDYPPKDLCRYFWTTVASAILCFFLYIGWGIYIVLRPIFRPLGRGIERLEPHSDTIGTAIGVLLAIIAGAIALALIGWGVWALFYNTDDFLHGVLTVLIYAGMVVLILAAGLLVLIALAGAVHLGKKWNRSRPPKPAKPGSAKPAKEKKKKIEGDSTWTVIWTFLMSKKRRVCPLIQVVGDDEESEERHLRTI